jgi:hypothetical protein
VVGILSLDRIGWFSDNAKTGGDVPRADQGWGSNSR